MKNGEVDVYQVLLVLEIVAYHGTKKIKVPLLYDTLEESINVMGHLFGRDAALEILENKKTMRWMSMGITFDDKKSLAKKLERK